MCSTEPRGAGTFSGLLQKNLFTALSAHFSMGIAALCYRSIQIFKVFSGGNVSVLPHAIRFHEI